MQHSGIGCGMFLKKDSGKKWGGGGGRGGRDNLVSSDSCYLRKSLYKKACERIW